MPLVPSFTTSQVNGFPNAITITDTSTGSDASIVTRVIIFTDKSGNNLTPIGTTLPYTGWVIGTNTITVNVLQKDMALTITISYLDINGVVVTSKSNIALFTLFSKTFLYSLTQYQSSNPAVTKDTVYYNNKAKLYSFVLGAENAILIANDIAGAQLSLDEATFLISNPKNFF